MELDDLRAAWRELDGRVEAALAHGAAARVELRLDKARSALRPLTALLWYELVSGVVLAVLFGGFLAGHLHEVRFAVPAAALHVLSILAIVAGARQLVLLGGLDWSDAVVSIQRRLERLRVSRVRTAGVILTLVPLLWTPLAIVAAEGLFGLDLYRAFGVAWIAANLAFGVAAIPLIIWIAKRARGRVQRSRILQSLADDLAGRSLARAEGFLEEIADFERA